MHRNYLTHPSYIIGELSRVQIFQILNRIQGPISCANIQKQQRLSDVHQIIY